MTAPPGQESSRAPSHFERGAHARGECFARTDAGVALGDFQALDPARLALAGVRGAGRGGLRRARIGPHDAFVREYRRGGMLAWWLPAWRASPQRLLDELALSGELERRDLATPRALGGWALRRGGGYELYLATVVVADAQDVVASLADGQLARCSARARRRAARALGRFVRRLHEGGLAHPDLQPRNLLVRGAATDAEFLVLDLDRARIVARLERAERAAQLARLWRWWVKRPAELARVRRGERAAFWIGYAPRAEGRTQRRGLLAAAAASFRRTRIWHELGWRALHACALLASFAALACGSGAPARAVAIASAVERPACDPRVAHWRILPTRGGARSAFERGECELFVGTLCEFLRSARHGGRTPRVLAAARAAQPLRLLARPALERVVELKGRAVGLDPDQDGLLVLTRLLHAERLELEDVQLEWRDASVLADELERGELGAIVLASSEGRGGDGWTVLVGSTELERERSRDVARALDALAPQPLEPRELVELQLALDELEQALVAVGELVGPTGGADALRASAARVRQLRD